MRVIFAALLGRHRQILQFLLDLLKSRSTRILFDLTGLEICHPLVKRSFWNFVVDIDADQIIFREHLAWKMRNDHSVFFRIHKKVIAGVDAFEARLAVIDIVVALAIVTVEDTD